MEVAVHRAVLTIEGRKVRLTKDIARQLPLRSWVANERHRRIEAGRPVPKAICKIMAKVFDRHRAGWLILIPDAIAGLAWTGPVIAPPDKKLDDTRAWDDLRSIPTVIL